MHCVRRQSHHVTLYYGSNQPTGRSQSFKSNHHVTCNAWCYANGCKEGSHWGLAGNCMGGWVFLVQMIFFHWPFVFGLWL